MEVRLRRGCLTGPASGGTEDGPMTDGGMSDQELAEIRALVEAASPGPWYVRVFDDASAMNLVAVTTVPDDGAVTRFPDSDQSTLVAATLVQHPRYVEVADGRWDENAQFIAAAREVIPRLLAEISRLRSSATAPSVPPDRCP